FEEWSPWSPLSGEEVVQAAWPVDRETAHVLTAGGQVYRCRVGQSIADVKAAVAAAADERCALQPADGGATAITGVAGGLLVAFEGGEIRRVEANGTTSAIATTGQGRIVALAAAGGTMAAADADAGTIVV